MRQALSRRQVRSVVPRAWAAVLGGMALQALAQIAPDTGRLLHDNEALRRPAPAARAQLPEPAPPAALALATHDGLRVQVSAFRFSRNTLFSSERLSLLVQDLLGHELGMAELQLAADRITAFYRQQGYVLASAFLPAQDIIDQGVEIAVLEGHLGQVRLDNRSLVGDRIVLARTAPLKPGQPLSRDALERGLLLVNSLAGVEVQSTLTPGASVGTADLDIRVIARDRISANAGLDNFGNRFSGAWRVGAQLGLDNPLQVGDSVVLRVNSAGAPFGYARVGYQLPVASDGLQAGVAASAMSYRLEEDFAALRAHGKAGIGSAYVLYPLLLGRKENIHLQASFDHKRLKDFGDSAGVVNRKKIRILTLGASGDRVDERLDGGGTNWSLSYTVGRLAGAVDDGSPEAPMQLVGGRYEKLSATFARQQRLETLMSGWMLAIQVSGQFSTRLSANGAGGRSLDSSEKFSLGGAQGIRAYPQGEAASDDAWMSSVELRRRVAPEWQISAFFDTGAGWIDHAPTPSAIHNRRRLSGAGFGAAHVRPGGLSWNVTVAWRTAQAPTSDRDRMPRLWTSLSQAL